MGYQEYLATPALMKAIKNPYRKRLLLGKRILSFDPSWLRAHPSYEQMFNALAEMQHQNPLRFYMPHCANSETVEASTGAQFINDRTHIVTGLRTGNQYGKTTAALVKALTQWGCIQTEPFWEVYKEHGINYVPFQGPQDILISSFAWSNLRGTIWPEVLRKWLPKDEIEGLEHYSLPQNSTPGFNIKLKKSGTTFWFLGMNQPQSAIESRPYDNIFWDEFAFEAKFDGGEARLTTRRLLEKDDDGNVTVVRGAHITALTPIKLPGMPDTGGDTFLKDMEDGSNTKGLSCRIYQANIIDDVPDWYISETSKKEKLDSLIEAEKTNNKHQVRHLRARLYGEYETHGDAIYPQFDREVHVLRPFTIPDNWTAYRIMDYGRTAPTACIWVAVNPENDYFIYRVTDIAGAVISEQVNHIVKHSGNKLERVGEVRVRDYMVPAYREKQIAEHYAYDAMDCASFKKPDEQVHKTIGECFRSSGLNRLRPAEKGTFEQMFAAVRERLEIRAGRKHYETGKAGAPSVYIFSTCDPLIKDIERYLLEPDPMQRADGTFTERPKKKPHLHFPDCLNYSVMEKLKWNPHHPIRPASVLASKANQTWWVEEKKETSRRHRRVTDPYTGY